MQLQPHWDPSEHDLGERTELLPGAEEKRVVSQTWQVASGTFACPACDVPVYFAGAVTLGVALGCPYCDHAAPAREFLTLTDEPRPARVRVTATIPAGLELRGVERGERDRSTGGSRRGDGEHEGASAPR